MARFDAILPCKVTEDYPLPEWVFGMFSDVPVPAIRLALSAATFRFADIPALKGHGFSSY